MSMMNRHRRRPSGRVAKLLAASALLAVAATGGQALALTQVSNFGSNPGNLRMFKHVPSSMPSNAPLVVALHGCTQTASAYDNETGWTKYANRDKFYLVLPEQPSSNNQNSCFNWFENGDITRGYGEALSIKQMVDKMKSQYSIDSSKVFVTGLSAGGYMTTVMLATYPDVFSGGAPIAGGPYRCGVGMNAAFSCMSPGPEKSPSQWGDLVRNASNHNGPWPKVSLWHGDADYTVKIKNMTENMEQWTNVHGTDQSADSSNSVKGYPHKVYKKSGNPVVETYTITGMGHGTPVDPGSAADQCGSAGAYILDVDICSSYFIGRFFDIVADAGTGGGDGGDDGGSDDPNATCWTTSNANHHAAGRTHLYSGNYYAKGSWQWLAYADDVTSLEQTGTDYYVKVSSCQ